MDLHWPSVPAMIFLLILGVVSPLLDLWWVNKVKARPALRASAYRWLVAGLWALAVAMWRARGGAGLVVLRAAGEAAWMLGRPWREVLVGGVTVVLFGAVLTGGISCVVQPRRVPAYTRAHRSIGWFLPHTASERWWWAVVSVTAGINEEWIFRGYVLHMFRSQVGFSLTAAMVLSSVLFGLGHVYQGWRAGMTSGVVGFMLAVVAVLTGGLAAAMVLHALMDLQILAMFRPAVVEVPAPTGD